MSPKPDTSSRKRRAYIFTWREQLLDSDVRPPLAKFVGLVVSEDADYSDGKGAHPGMRRIQRRTGLAAGTVAKYLRLLCELGWLHLAKEGTYVQRGEERTASVYDLTVPERREPARKGATDARARNGTSGKFVAPLTAPPDVPLTSPPLSTVAPASSRATGGQVGAHDPEARCTVADQSIRPTRPLHTTTATSPLDGARQPTKADQAAGRRLSAGAATPGATADTDDCECFYARYVTHMAGAIAHCEHS